jgi:adenylate cyclase
MQPGSSVRRVVRRLAFVGVATKDPDETRAQKAVLTLAAALVTILAIIWVATYWVLGLPRAAAIPFVYQVASVASLLAFARTKSYRFFRFSHAAMMTLLPFMLQWALGGYVASSAVSLWALVAAIGTLFFFTADESIPWFVAFLALTLLSGLLEPTLSRSPAAIPDPIRIAFFVLNVTGVSLTAYALLQYAVRARDEAFARSEGLLLNVLPKTIAERLKREPGVIAEAHAEVTVLFADVVDFTPFTEQTEPERVVGVLDESSARSTRSPSGMVWRRSRRSVTRTWSPRDCPSREPTTPKSWRRWRSICRPSLDGYARRLVSTWQSGLGWTAGR